jgi:hypothetical protein
MLKQIDPTSPYYPAVISSTLYIVLKKIVHCMSYLVSRDFKISKTGPVFNKIDRFFIKTKTNLL